MSAGALSASSLQAGAGVVTMRLAQGCCRLARTALQQGSHWLAPMRLVGVKMPRVCHTRHAWRRTLLIETDGAAGAVEQGCHPRMRMKPDCGRVPVERGCGRTAAGANWLDAVRTLTTGLRVSPSLAAAGFQEMRPVRALLRARAMRLRASSGLTQPAWKTIRCRVIRCTMAKSYFTHSANRQTRG